MGNIPSEDNMISTLISFPLPGEVFPPMRPFTIKFKASNLVAGSVTNPNSTFLSAPQSLRDGKVVGHFHVVIQSLAGYIRSDGQNFTLPPDPTKFVFFHTFFDAGDGKGGFSVDVPEGLPIGSYRVCTMAAASNHQPVLMPVSSLSLNSISEYLLTVKHLDRRERAPGRLSEVLRQNLGILHQLASFQRFDVYLQMITLLRSVKTDAICCSSCCHILLAGTLVTERLCMLPDNKIPALS